MYGLSLETQLKFIGAAIRFCAHLVFLALTWESLGSCLARCAGLLLGQWVLDSVIRISIDSELVYVVYCLCRYGFRREEKLRLYLMGFSLLVDLLVGMPRFLKAVHYWGPLLRWKLINSLKTILRSRNLLKPVRIPFEREILEDSLHLLYRTSSYVERHWDQQDKTIAKHSHYLETLSAMLSSAPYDEGHGAEEFDRALDNYLNATMQLHYISMSKRQELESALLLTEASVEHFKWFNYLIFHPNFPSLLRTPCLSFSNRVTKDYTRRQDLRDLRKEVNPHSRPSFGVILEALFTTPPPPPKFTPIPVSCQLQQEVETWRTSFHSLLEASQVVSRGSPLTPNNLEEQQKMTMALWRGVEGRVFIEWDLLEAGQLEERVSEVVLDFVLRWDEWRRAKREVLEGLR